MRISKDQQSWRASGVIRRDWRSRRDTPEIPRHKGKKSVKRARKACKTHIPIVASYRDVPLKQRETADGTIYYYRTLWELRCGLCGTHEGLGTPAYLEHYYVLTTGQLQELLADTWCRKGHLYCKDLETIETAWGHTYRQWREYCLMCGKRRGPRRWRGPVRITEDRLLAATGLNETQREEVRKNNYYTITTLKPDRKNNLATYKTRRKQ